ncbi:S-adenosylmethionine decarboxylase [Candidatus Parcubacteria bacterium]|nr:S-adenosylmethionine decarboxylase [Patescibacteria group bacterium]MCG2694203.1 S-adenosylmethionine decarboxylase [Candidatus Parcubacteria bacterium]
METKHLKVLGLGDPEIMGDATLVRTFMEKLIKEVGMRPLGEPTVHDVPLDLEKLGVAPFEDEGGVTTQIVGYHTLSTSHAAIHTWPLRKEFHLDLYSCRNFDAKHVEEFIKNYFKCTKTKITNLTYATEW